MDAKTPGDGKTSPFGKNEGPMPGIDFIKNPAGSKPGGAGADFLTKPAGQGPTAAAPPDFTKGGKDAQKSGSDPTNPQSDIAANSGPGLRPDAAVPPGSPRASFIGVGSIGNTSKPFKGF